MPKLKPSERIHQIGESLTGYHSDASKMMLAIIEYLDECDRFENPNWEAESTRIVKERSPEVVAMKVFERARQVGCPEEGIPFEDEARLYVNVVVQDALKAEKDWIKLHQLSLEIDCDLYRFSNLPIRHTVRSESEVSQMKVDRSDWPALTEKVTA